MPTRIDGGVAAVFEVTSEDGARSTSPHRAATARNSVETYRPDRTAASERPPGFEGHFGIGATSVGALFGGARASGTAHAAQLMDLVALVAKIVDLAQAVSAGDPSPARSPAMPHQNPSTIARAGDRSTSAPCPDGTTRVKREGSFDTGLVRGTGITQAETHRGTGTSSQVSLGAGGISAVSRASASVGASASADGEVGNDLGSARGHVGVSAELFARVQGEAKAGLKGAEASATAEVGALVTADANADVQVLGGLARASAKGIAQSGTGACATADVTATIDPPQAAVQGKAGAFAGAKAGFEASAGVAGAVERISAEAWAGVGAKAEFNMGLKDGKLHITLGLGAAVGVGAFLRTEAEVDFHDAGSVARSLGGLAIGALGAVADGVFGVVAGRAGNSRGSGAHASKVLDDFLTTLLGALTSPTQPRASPASGSPTIKSSGDGALSSQQTTKSIQDRFLGSTTVETVASFDA